MVSRKFEITYTLTKDAPAPWGWDRYKDYLLDRFPQLLNTGNGERTVQTFLEENPCLVPGGEGGDGSGAGHHGYLHGGVYARPGVSGTFNREPDFVWLTKTSEALVPVMIEIEDPSKAWFTSDGQERAALTQARTQLSEWQVWFNDGNNQETFRRSFRLDGQLDFGERLQLDPRFFLIYGRRSEATANQLANSTRVFNDRTGTRSMTFDRLIPNEGSRNAVTLRHRYPGPSEAMHIPPTWKIGPWVAGTLANTTGWNEAIDKNSLLSQERKDFLADRIPYWVDWFHAYGSGGRRGSRDYE